MRKPYWSLLEVGGDLGDGSDGIDCSCRSDGRMTVLEAIDTAVDGRSWTRTDHMSSLIASAILMDLRCSSSLIEVSLESLGSRSPSSVNPAAYMSIASSTVIPPLLETGRDPGSFVRSVTDVPLVKTLLRSVLVVSTWLDVVVIAERKLALTSSLLYEVCHGNGWLKGKSSKGRTEYAGFSRSMLLGFCRRLPVGFIDLESAPEVEGLDN